MLVVLIQLVHINSIIIPFLALCHIEIYLWKLPTDYFAGWKRGSRSTRQIEEIPRTNLSVEIQQKGKFVEKER